jgi:RNA polymerase sigma-70 factor, ECF subfamily
MSCRSDAVESSDVDLLRLAAAGDRDSFAVIFERYQHIVYRFARAMTGSDEIAEDVTQEVFVVLIRHLGRYQPERAALGTYLYGVVRNVSRERLRRDRRFLSLPSKAASWQSEMHSDDPFQVMAIAETGAQMRRALAGLPVKYREVVILCDLHDLAYAESAAILGTSTSTVRSRLHRGRHLLRRRLSRPHNAKAGRGASSSIGSATSEARCRYE